MTATTYELFAGRTQTIDSNPLKAEVEYIIKGAADETEVETAALADVPTSLTMQGIAVGRVSLDISERLNATTWKVKATFQQLDPNSPALLENTFQFDTGGATQHITQDLSLVNSYGPKAADLGGAIGFDGQSVNGVDIVIPNYEWTETYWFSDSYVTSTYKGYLAQLTGAVNAAAFKVGYAGEILFKGASGSKQGNGMWQIAFKFAYQQNKTGLTVGSITGIDKKGWEYLDVRYGEDVDGTAHILIQKPVAVYVHQVYPSGDFSLLGIGT